MVVETRYAAGGGVLLGAGEHWLLMTDPGDEQVLERLWSALGDGPRAAEEVLGIVETAFGGEPPALVLIDLTPGTGQTVSLGSGRVHVEGTARLISLGGEGIRASGPSTEPLRRFIGGVVAAQRAEIRPLRPKVVSAGTGTPASNAPAPVAGMIDGIPQAILEARGPEGAPAPRPRRLRPVLTAESGPRDTSEPDPLFNERIVGASAEVTESRPDDHANAPAPAVTASYDDQTAAVPAHSGEPVGTTGSAGTTGTRPAGSPVEEHDHDGSTVYRSGGPEHLASSTGETVQAVWCPDGHMTPPDSPLCRVCRKQVAPQAAQRVSRPTLGGLRLPTGEVVPLDRGVVLGRRPAPVPGSGDWPHLVHLSAEHTYVSRLHVQIELDGWLVIARDLGSRGGTTRKVPGRPPEKMVPDESYVIEPGHALDLADVYEVRYEVGPEVTL
ncbi:hypothetical protein [Nocardioides sp. InS609-2]|uniref:hypothetical protein n=1 Tax=Nocardioides sp. InS609-2 TaxID=2760705 RepID=UPI0020C0D517|nr:hypothetical protein [Nocardioides sp. InS609-2]